MNFLCASILSICFFITKTWRAGDAKLFMLYALLMPPVSSPIIQNFSCIHHIAITFLIGSTFLIPFVIQDIIKNKEAILPKILSKNTFELLKDSFFITLAIGWIIFPLIHQLRLFQNPLLSFLFIYILYIVLYSLFDRWTESKWLAISILLFGLALRIFFMPHFFTWHYFLQFITLTLFYSLTFRILFLTIATLQSSKDRIAFAPFLFIGSILSYTNFLQTVIVIIQSMLKH